MNFIEDLTKRRYDIKPGTHQYMRPVCLIEVGLPGQVPAGHPSYLCYLAELSGKDLTVHDSVKIIRPLLHHHPASLQLLCAVISTLDLVLWRMRQLAIDNFMPIAEAFFIGNRRQRRKPCSVLNRRRSECVDSNVFAHDDKPALGLPCIARRQEFSPLTRYDDHRTSSRGD
jgi:hypothetical protein